MERFTTYHEGVAVLQDENRLADAIKKLAKFEDIEEEAVKEAIEIYILTEFKPPAPKLGGRVEEVGFSGRVLNILKQNKINYIDELCRLTEYDILKMRHAGKIAVDEIEAKLKVHGRRLGE